jgi:uncharacterized membrane protein
VLAPLSTQRRDAEPAPAHQGARHYGRAAATCHPGCRSAAIDQGEPQNLPPKFAIGQAVAKTITFRTIVTTLDFSTNYLVIGEVATAAAGLSSFNLIAGPLFYLAHEAAWNYLGPPDDAVFGPPALPRSTRETGERRGLRRLTVSRALAKTVISGHCLDDGLRHQLCGGARRGLGPDPRLRLHP